MTGHTKPRANRLLSRDPECWVPGFLAAGLAVFLAASVASAQDVRLERPFAGKIEITGGPAVTRWRIPYGTSTNFTAAIYSESAPEGHVYFTHGPWLRLIDATRGVVVGRWRFPAAILGVTSLGPGGRVEVRFDIPRDSDPSIGSAPFDPASGRVPNWDAGSLLSYRASETEAGPLTAGSPRTGTDVPLPAAEARARLADLEAAVWRDPLSPWLHVARGKLLRDAGDSRAGEVLDQAVRAGITDFTDLFRIAAFLERVDAPGPALAAYERAFTNYLERGNDPRLITLIARLVLYSPFPRNQAQLSDARRAELIERVYSLAPAGEGAERAWAAYADYFARRGQSEQAGTWRARAEVAKTQTLVGLAPDLLIAHDRIFLVAAASIVTALMLIMCLYLKYLPERRLAIAAETGQGRRWRFGIFNLQYWSRRERLAFLLIVILAWCAAGLTGPYLLVVSREAAIPISPGSFAGPLFKSYFATRLPATPWRDLVLAIGHQQGGELEEAERLYRALPQFAESWNNLGVLLQTAGKEADARQAFARARELDPRLPEAALNLGEPTNHFVTTVLRRYLPMRPIVAAPQRNHLFSAYFGAEWSDRFSRAFLGPFTLFGLDDSLRGFIPLWPAMPLAVILALAVAMLLWLIPSREVTQAPGTAFRVCEWIFPGISPVWGALGTAALLVWTAFVLVVVLQLTLGTPYVLAAIALPGLQRAYGLPPDIPPGFSDINPSPIAVFAILALLLAVNLFLVHRTRRGL